MTTPSIPLATPPTDNLYKFAAVAGLTWLVASSIFLNSTTSKIYSDKRTILEATNSVAAEARSLASFYRDTIWIDKSSKPDEGFELIISADLRRRTQSDTTLQRQLADLDNRIIALNLSNEQAMDALKNTTKSGLVAMSDIAAALFATALGFAAWYTQYQRHQDELLRLQLQQARREAGISTDADSRDDPSLRRRVIGFLVICGILALSTLVWTGWNMLTL